MASVAVNTAVNTIELFGSAYDEAARADIAALEARVIATAGLATGGGDLSADRTITVPKASGAEAETGTLDDRAVTPLALATPLTAVWTDLMLRAPLDSPALTGLPTAPQAALGTATTQIATTGFVAAALEGGGTVAEQLAEHLADTANPHAVDKADVGLGNVANLAPADLPVSSATQIALNLKAPLASPVFTGVPAGPTAAPGASTTQLSTTAFVAAAIGTVQAAVDLKAPLASAALTGTPTAPQAALGTATTQIATTGFVAAAVDAATGGDSVLAEHLADTSNPHAVTKAQVGLSAVDNTADLAKPVSTATQAAINAVSATAAAAQADIDGHQANTSNPHAVTKAQVGLAAVDNTADLAKPVSTATQAAINAVAGDAAQIAADLAAHAANTNNPHTVDKADVGLGNVANLAPADLPVSSATQIALNLKAPLASPILTGTPTAPTAAAGANTTQLATTAFVAAGLALTASSTEVDAAQAAADAAQAAADAAQAAADAAQAAADAAQITADAAQTAASEAITDAAAALTTGESVPDLVGRRHERPGDSESLFGLDAAGEPMSIMSVDPAWALVTVSGRVLRITADAASDPRLIAPRGVFPVETGQGWVVRWKVQRQVDPADPLNDSVSLKVRWMDQNKATIADSTIEDMPLVVSHGVQERRAFLASGGALPPPAGAVYFRPYIALYGGDHVTDIVVIEARQTAAMAGAFYVPVLDADPATAPGPGRVALYAVRNPDGTANLRVQGGTSAAATDLIVNFGAGV